MGLKPIVSVSDYKLFSAMLTPYILYQILQQHSPLSSYWVAYSGGLDSHVLLHALVKLRADHPMFNLQAIHVHHGLSSHADTWAVHCQQICDDLDVKLTIHHIDSKSYNEQGSTEEIARHYRYQFFSDSLPEGECLLTAHHRNDQAETVLFRLLRGSGLNGLSAMASQRPLGKGLLLRPLLTISRADLEVYANHEKLHWIEDESNLHTYIDRNYLRHCIFPLLTVRWPRAAEALSRTATHAQEANQLLEEMACEDIQKVRGAVENTLSLSALKKYHHPRQKNIIRFWLKNRGFSLPSTKKLNQLLHDCLDAKEDAMPLLTWEGVEVRCFDGDLYAIPPLSPHDAKAVIPWDMQALLLLENIGWMRATEVSDSSAFNTNTIDLPQDKKITVRFRQGGEIVHPAGRVGSHPLKKLFQEWGVPPWMRDRIPLLYCDNELAMVVGYAVAGKYTGTSHRRGRAVMLEFFPGLIGLTRDTQ